MQSNPQSKYLYKIVENEVATYDYKMGDMFVLPFLEAIGEDGKFSLLYLSLNYFGCKRMQNIIQEMIIELNIRYRIYLALDLYITNWMDALSL